MRRPLRRGCERAERLARIPTLDVCSDGFGFFLLPVEAALPKSVIRRSSAPNGVSVGLLFAGAFGPNPPSEAQTLGPSFCQPPKALLQEPAAGVALNGAHLMHDAYNLILADHLAFAMGAGGFLLGLVTGRLRRRRKSKPGGVEVHDYYGVD